MKIGVFLVTFSKSEPEETQAFYICAAAKIP
jgi:hypothetical protein